MIADDLCEQHLYLLVNILTGEAELLVEYLVRSRETKALKTPNSTVGTYQTFEVYGQTSGQTELLLACGQDSLLILLRLAAEQTLRRNAHDASLDAVGSQQLGTSGCSRCPRAASRYSDERR